MTKVTVVDFLREKKRFTDKQIKNLKIDAKNFKDLNDLTPLDVLLGVKNLLADEKDWCNGYYLGVDINGHAALIKDSSKLTIGGAIACVADEIYYINTYKTMAFGNIEIFNTEEFFENDLGTSVFSEGFISTYRSDHKTCMKYIDSLIQNVSKMIKDFEENGFSIQREMCTYIIKDDEDDSEYEYYDHIPFQYVAYSKSKRYMENVSFAKLHKDCTDSQFKRDLELKRDHASKWSVLLKKIKF